MNTQSSLINILTRWPDRKSLADDLNVNVVVVHRWHQRGNVPSLYFAALLFAAKERNIPLTPNELINAASNITDQDGHKARKFKRRVLITSTENSERFLGGCEGLT